MPGGSGGGFLDTVSDWASKAYDYAEQAYDYAADSWLYRQVETGYNWVKGDSGQRIINNLIDAYEYTSYADFENYISKLIFIIL